ncbi:MAG: glycosyltransferase [Alphaproteobacteria bacterium]|nr:glycosyltransferase [Alphaproteobacteria bacterium]
MTAQPLTSLTLVIRSLDGGGMQRFILSLADGFARQGVRVTLVCAQAAGEMGKAVPAGVEVRVLRPAGALQARLAVRRAAGRDWRAVLPLLLPAMPGMFRRFPALVAYLREARPDAMLCAGTQSNLAAILARQVAQVPTRLVVSEHNTLSVVAQRGRGLFRRAYPRLVHRYYPLADAIVANSRGVAADLAATAGLPADRIAQIYYSIDTAALVEASAAPVDHPWLAGGGPPVILGVGRLHRQKDFATLLRAFAMVRTHRAARLVILGEGALRPSLEALARKLGVAGDVLLPGFVANPAAWMRRASVFALSSAWEGFALVVLEALAVGCPVVSTDCPNGPREILDDGAYGPLVPVGDDRAMATAIDGVLAAPPSAERLQARAAAFSGDAMLRRYGDLLARDPASDAPDRMPATDRRDVRPEMAGAEEQGGARRIAIFIHSLAGGGAQRRVVTLANAFAERGRRVDVVVVDGAGPLRARLTSDVRFIALNGSLWDPLYATIHPWLGNRGLRTFLSIRALSRYLRSERPDVLLSAASHVNLAGILAWRRAGRPMPVVLRASNYPAGNLPVRAWVQRWIRAALRWLASRMYPQADAIITVSRGVADEIVRMTGISQDRVTTIYNPVVTPALRARLRAPVDHAWLADRAIPVIIGVGRLAIQKDFPTLVRAFAGVRAVRPARLVILGDGPQRGHLQALVNSLGLTADVDMPGYVENAPAWVARASLFVLSSLWEGLPSVVIEALAAGCPVVSTDCPSGPREILQDGQYGALVPCHDPAAMTRAMLVALDAPPQPERLRARAADFSGGRAPDRYLAVLDACVAAAKARAKGRAAVTVAGGNGRPAR